MDLLFNTIMLEPNRWTAGHELSWPLTDLLAPIAAAGFGGLEVWGYHVDRLDEAGVEALAAGLARHGQRAVAVGAYPAFHLRGSEDERERERLDRLVAVAARLGARVFKIFPGRVGSATADDALWRRSVDRIRALAERLAGRGAILTLETHGNTLCDTLDSTRRLLAALPDAEAVGLCFQPYGDDDTDAAIAGFDALGPRVRHLHLQNRASDGRGVTRLEEGDWTDYRRFLPHVQRSGFVGVVGLEFTAGIAPAEGEPFDRARVLDNAMRDWRFVERIWGERETR